MTKTTNVKKLRLYPSYETEDFKEFSLTAQGLLEETALVEYLDESRSTCIENGNRFFVELVLNDGAEISHGEAIIKRLQERYEHRHFSVDGIVRAIWSVGLISSLGLCRDEYGNLRAAECFDVELKSGRGIQMVRVEVTHAAYFEIDNRLAKEDEGGKSLRKVELVDAIIRKLLETQLECGGESYWHPIKYPKQVINPAAVQVMLSRIENA